MSLCARHFENPFKRTIIPSILKARLDEYCRLIFRGKTMPWYLSMAMQVIVRMPVTMAVVCTKGTVLQTRTPVGKSKGVKQITSRKAAEDNEEQ